MAVFLIGLGIALFFLSIQWYVEKKADDAEALAQKHRRSHRARTAKRH